MKPQLFLWLLLVILFGELLLTLPLSLGAVVQGDIYDAGLNPLSKVIVTIDTHPAQQKVAKNSSYSFFVAPGNYTIEARYYEQNWLKYYLEQPVTVTQEGNFVVDLILWPNLSEEEQLYNETLINGKDDTDSIDFEENDSSRISGSYVLPIILFMLLVVAMTAYRVYRSRHHQHSQQQIQHHSLEQDSSYSQVLHLIQEHKRITQKDIRKAVPLSEAKISLIITELEEKGIVKKIKKGRGNIILLLQVPLYTKSEQSSK